MMLFLILAPFGSFGLLMLLASTAVSLFGAALVSAAVIALDLIRGRSIKALSAGCFVLFTGLGCYVALIDGEFSRQAIRFIIDAGVLGIALVSMAIRAPFTLQYARESVDSDTAKLPGFMQVNYFITYAWTAAFVLMLVADMLTVYAPNLPLWVGLGIPFVARYGASAFTTWYPAYRRSRLTADVATQPKA